MPGIETLVLELQEVAETCARLGGAILEDARSRGPGRVVEKAPNDFVTEVDAASEAAITCFLRERRPGDGLLAEEAATAGRIVRPLVPDLDGRSATEISDDVRSPDASLAGTGRVAGLAPSGAGIAPDVRVTPGVGISSSGAAISQSGSAPISATGSAMQSGGAAILASGTGVAWLVDPLDGTKNFIHGYPMYGVSVAARGPEGLLAGAVYDPTRDELFSAARGAGATLNGEEIHVTTVEPHAALVGTGFPFRHAHLREAYLESFRRVSAAVSDVRRAGSAALDLAYVACGRLDGFWELGLSPWDMAAGWLLIEEAGGHVTDERGGAEVFQRGHIVAGGAGVHRYLLDLVRPAFEGSVEPVAGWIG